MLRWIIGASLKHRALVIAVALVAMIIGISEVGDKEIDILPEFSQPFVEIQTEALGLSAAEVEELITVPMEAKLLSGVAWVDEIRSESIPSLSSIVLVFHPGTDILKARQMVQERLTQAGALPKVSKPPTMLQPVSSSNRLMKIGLSSNEVSHIDMSVLARWTIRPTLMGVHGVANVAIWGQRKRQLQVHVHPDELKDNNVSLQQVIKTTGNALWVSPLSFLQASTPGSGGWIDTPNQRLGVRHVLPIVEPEHLARVTVEGATVSLGEVAQVVENHQPLIGDAIVGDGPGLLLVVEKFPWANTLEVTEKVEDALAKLQPGLSGIKIDPTVFRPATFIENSIDNISKTLLIVGLCVVLMIIVLQYQWRIVLVNLIAIPLALLAALLVLDMRGASMNVMVLAGFVIALGIIIDDVVNDVRNIVGCLQSNCREGNKDSVAVTVVKAMRETRSGYAYATLIMVLAVVPVFFIQTGGVPAAFLKPLVLTYLTAVAASMAVAVTVTPVLSVLLFTKDRSECREPTTARWIRSGYVALFSSSVRRPVLPIILFALFTTCGVVMWSATEKALVPRLKENNLQVKLSSAPGTSHPEMNRILTQISRELRQISGVNNVGGLTGRAVMSDKVKSINTGELWVNIDSEVDYDATVAAVQEVVGGYPGLISEVLTYTKDKIEDNLLGSLDDITVRIYGHELDVLRSKAEELKLALSKIEGLVDLDVKHQIEEPVLQIKVDLEKAELHKIKPGDVRRSSAVLLAGIEVGSLFEEQKVFDVVVWGKPEIRSDLNRILDLTIDKPDGGHVKLADVADVRIVPSQTVIKREGISRYLDIGAKVRGRKIGLAAKDIERTIQTVHFPLKYHAELIGRFAKGNTAPDQIWPVTIFVALGMVLLLQAALGSWRAAFVVFLTLPMALSGGVIAEYAFGGTLSVGSIAGLIMVFGISIRNSITLIRQYRRLERQDGDSFGPELIIRGTQEQVASMVTVAALVISVFLPFFFFGEIQGLEIIYPMSIAVIGGIATCTLVNVMVVPALSSQFGIGKELELNLGRTDKSLQPATSE
jgi:Cu/Ag efflux pump CusA